MSRRRTILLLSSVGVATLFIAIMTHSATANAPRNPRATGGGTTVEGGKKSTFVFNAIKLPNGSVQGHLVYQVRCCDTIIQMDIDCLKIVGNKAIMSGVVKKVGGNPPFYVFVGAQAVFQVQDNGEGGDAPPDQISDLEFRPNGASCNDLHHPPPGVYLDIDGNIQVQP
jgi:hypothetical protein